MVIPGRCGEPSLGAAVGDEGMANVRSSNALHSRWPSSERHRRRLQGGVEKPHDPGHYDSWCYLPLLAFLKPALTSASGW